MHAALLRPDVMARESGTIPAPELLLRYTTPYSGPTGSTFRIEHLENPTMCDRSELERAGTPLYVVDSPSCSIRNLVTGKTS